MSSVMLVSEDRMLAKMVKEALAGSGARLTSVCGSPRAASDAFQQAPPTMVVVETFLPDSSGLEILKVLKRMNEKCLFVMLSRLRTRSSIERAFRLGAHDVLTFPLDGDSLRQTLLHRLEAQPLEAEADAEDQAEEKPARKK